MMNRFLKSIFFIIPVVVFIYVKSDNEQSDQYNKENVTIENIKMKQNPQELGQKKKKEGGQIDLRPKNDQPTKDGTTKNETILEHSNHKQNPNRPLTGTIENTVDIKKLIPQKLEKIDNINSDFKKFTTIKSNEKALSLSGLYKGPIHYIGGDFKGSTYLLEAEVEVTSSGGQSKSVYIRFAVYHEGQILSEAKSDGNDVLIRTKNEVQGFFFHYSPKEVLHLELQNGGFIGNLYKDNKILAFVKLEKSY